MEESRIRPSNKKAIRDYINQNMVTGMTVVRGYKLIHILTRLSEMLGKPFSKAKKGIDCSSFSSPLDRIKL